MPFMQRVLSPIVGSPRAEGVTALMMFAYSFLAMTAYNVIKPLTRSKFISDLGADNLPYVLLAAGFIIGILMTGYAWLMARLPRRWGLPDHAGGHGGDCWSCSGSCSRPTRPGSRWRSTLPALMLGVLLISQFWTLANVVYDPRQAKRLFGFIGGGAPLGGIAGSALAAYAPTNRLDESAACRAPRCMAMCAVLVTAIIRRENVEPGIDRSPTGRRAKRASAAPRPSTCSADRSTCRSSRWSSALPRSARPSSSSS